MPAVFSADQIVPEDLTPALMLSDVKKTPVFSMIPKGDKLKNMLYSWGITGMGDRRPRGVPENKDVDAFEGDSSKRVYNRAQEFWRTPRVTKIADKVNTGDTLLKYNGQVTKKMNEQKRDIEYRLLSTADSHEDDGVYGDEFKALGHAIDDGTLTDTDAQTAIPAAFKTPTAQIYTSTVALFKQENLRDMAKSRFDLLGATSEFVFVCGSNLKAWISDTFGNYVANPPSGYTIAVRTDKNTYDLTRKKLTMAVIEILETEFGIFPIMMSQWIGSDGIGGLPNLNYAYGLDIDGLMIRPLMYADHTELEYRGGGRSGLIDAILGYEYGDPRMHLKVAPSG